MVRSDEADHRFWKRIWGLPVPNKVKHFVWRLAHDTLPLRANLERRGMDIDTRCVMCSRIHEDGAHLFFKCKHVIDVWRLLQLESERQTLAQVQSARGVVQAIMNRKDELCSRLLILLWSWWDERNKVREGEQKKPTHILAQGIHSYAAESLSLLKKETPPKVQVLSRWKKPATGILKINCDGAHNSGTEIGGWGFVIRDSDGDMLHAGWGRIDRSIDAFYAEVLACWHGVRMAMDLGMGHIDLETDSMLVKQALQSCDFNRAIAGGLIIEVKNMLRYDFLSSRVSHVRRDGNDVAHEFAKLGCDSNPGTDPRRDSIPACILNLVASESAAPSG